jgi:FAD-linked oxidoreductase
VSRRGLTRRAFLGGALAASALATLPRRDAAASPIPLPWRNWSGLLECRPARRLGPASEADVLAQLTGGSGVIRPAGAGHSFSALVPCDDALLFLDRMSGVIDADPSTLQAEVWAGTRLGQLGPALGVAGQAMPNLPDIDYQTLGGALATSTHGTGARFGSLASQVVALTLATPRGELLECDARRNAEVFHAARSSLGALGVVTRVRLQNQAAFRLVERTEWRDLDAVLADLPRERDGNRHFEFYVFPHSSVALAITTNETEAEPYARGEDDPQGLHTLRSLHRWTRWLPAALGGALYDALIRASPSTERADWSHRVLAHPRTTRFNEMEYTVPAEAGPACLRELLETIRARVPDVCFPIECRYVRADDVWLSMFHERDGFSISVHEFHDVDPRPYFAAVEPVFWKYDGRPHWGKLHVLGAQRLAALYPRWRDFQAVRRALDPGSRLLNAHLATLFGAGA